MVYIPREKRKLIENDGNTALYAEYSGQLYVLDNGRKIYFTAFEPSIGTQYFYSNPNYYGNHTWDIFAVEKNDDFYQLISRHRFDKKRLNRSFTEELSNTTDDQDICYEIALFNSDGLLVAKEYPQDKPWSGIGAYYKDYTPHNVYIKNLIGRFFSPLEEWVVNDIQLLEEYLNGIKITPRGFKEANDNGKLEDWAYHKYVELYPGEKVPSTYGIEGNYPSAENAYFGKKTLTGNFRDYKFYNRGSGKYEIKTDSGFDEITGMTLEFTDKTIDAVDDIKGVFDQVTGLNTDSGKMFRLYNAAFARFPDASGLQYWIGKYTSGENDERVVASSFIASSEFKERYGDNVSNPKYVETLYTNVLGRDYDQSGYNYWLGNLNNGLETRYELLLGFAESTENKTLFSEMTGFV